MTRKVLHDARHLSAQVWHGENKLGQTVQLLVLLRRVAACQYVQAETGWASHLACFLAHPLSSRCADCNREIPSNLGRKIDVKDAAILNVVCIVCYSARQRACHVQLLVLARQSVAVWARQRSSIFPSPHPTVALQAKGPSRT